MAKPIGMRAHRPGSARMAFDNLAIINDDFSANSETGDDSSPKTPKGRSWEKYAVEQDKPSNGKKVAKCLGLSLMVVVLFTLTASLVIKDRADQKRMHDYDERMKHTSVDMHNETSTSTPALIRTATYPPPQNTSTKVTSNPVYSDNNTKKKV